jgi:hypothetical protein
MRRPSGRILNRTLTVTRQAWGVDDAYGRVVTGTTTATLPGTLQQARADRVPEQLRAAASIDCMALFGSDPELAVDDLVDDGSTVMSVKAVVDELGTAGYWVAYGTRKV